MALLELSVAGFFFLMGLLLAAFSFHTKRPPLLFAGGVIWMVLGVLTLTGSVIQVQNGVIVNYTYVNLTTFSNTTNATGFTANTTTIAPVLSYTNQTTQYVPLTNGKDLVSLSTAGLFGFVMLLCGIYFVGLSYVAQLEMRKDQEAN